MKDRLNIKKDSKILVTGAAGFIGFHLCKKLISDGFSVVGIDNLNGYYDVNLKLHRLNQLGIKLEIPSYNSEILSSSFSNFSFYRMEIQDRNFLPALFEKENFTIVCHLAAQAGVRYSLENPEVYIDSNLVGFGNILECCRNYGVEHLVYASSSSVYGQSKKVPFSTEDNVDHPISLYASTKKCNELMAYTYSHLYNFKTTGLRFFTVYGPWGRPDMAMFLFTDAIIKNQPIKVFNEGNLERDFTYIDDIVAGVFAVLTTETTSSNYSVYNIGNGHPVKLLNFIAEIENQLGKKAEMILMPMQPGDVNLTWADSSELQRDYGYKTSTSVKEGVKKFIDWYKEYYIQNSN